MNYYSHLLADKPLIVLTFVAILAFTTLCIPFILKPFPDFTDPTLGFEARGTILSNRLTSWENLIEATRPSGSLSVNPRDLFKQTQKPSKQRKRKKLNKWKNSKNSDDVFNHSAENVLNDQSLKERKHEHWSFSRNISYAMNDNDEADIALQKNRWESIYNLTVSEDKHDHKHFANDGYFCNSPNPQYAHMVISKSHNESLFSLKSLLTMCIMEQSISSTKHYEDLCQTIIDVECCKAWSLPNYVAMIGGRQNCSQITERDVNRTLDLLQDCAKFYHNMKLHPDCFETDLCPGVPERCKLYDTVYNILHYLTDINFLPPNEYNIGNLDNVMLFLPLASSSASLPFYYSLPNLNRDGIYISAMDLGIKNILFEEYLLEDTWLIGLGAFCVLLCMLLYTRSLFLTSMTLAAVVFSLGLSYFIYTIVFNLRFFPFMNLLAVVIAVGIAADDAFILIKIWYSERSQLISAQPFLCAGRANHVKNIINKRAMRPLMNNVLNHAFPCMLVSSLTTGAALYASYFSNINAIRCFGIFSGTAVLANYLFMISWMPAAISLLEKFDPRILNRLKEFGVCGVLLKRLNLTFYGQGRNFETIIIETIVKFKYIWILTLGALAIASAVAVLYKPQLKLPDTQDFQLFDTLHPFEQYDLVYRDKFWFERFMRNGSDSKLPLRFVWGILPLDNGNYLDPSSRGSLVFDETFNLSNPDSQLWLLQFCRNLRGQDFYQSTMGLLLPNCFIENFITWMNRRCIDIFNKTDRSPCCETSTFPYAPHVFDYCLIEAVGDLYETPREFFIPGVAGPKFTKITLDDVNSLKNITDNDIRENIVKALVVEFDSNVVYSLSFEEMNNFYTRVDNWTKTQMFTAPNSMNRGWFISHLNFYDLQATLSTGTLLAIGLSMGIALLVLFLVTLNILLSLYAIITVTCVIFVTVAILILLGWKLNVLESIAVSTAIGLAVDFSLHYSVHYKMAPDMGTRSRENNTKYSLKRMCAPTIMAMFTTFMVGAFMLPSRILAYVQIGLFLVVIMTVSWIYSTLFLGSLLYTIGPQHGFWQFTYPRVFLSSCQMKFIDWLNSKFNCDCMCQQSNQFGEIQETMARERNPSRDTDENELESFVGSKSTDQKRRGFCLTSVKFSNKTRKSSLNNISPTSAISIIISDDMKDRNS